jgi:hypothetical protein
VPDTDHFEDLILNLHHHLRSHRSKPSPRTCRKASCSHQPTILAFWRATFHVSSLRGDKDLMLLLYDNAVLACTRFIARPILLMLCLLLVCPALPLPC